MQMKFLIAIKLINAKAYVVKDLRGPYRRLIGKLNKIVPWSPND